MFDLPSFIEHLLDLAFESASVAVTILRAVTGMSLYGLAIFGFSFSIVQIHCSYTLSISSSVILASTLQS